MNLTRVGSTLLAIALPFVLTGVATANPHTSLTLTLAAPERGDVVVELECFPSGGSHPNADTACAELLRSSGDFDALADNQEPMSCTMEYRPVVAMAEGTWLGMPVSWTREFGNGCALHTATGMVFVF